MRETIRRAKHGEENPYFMMRRASAQDRRLSYEARGVLAYLLSKPDDWEIQVGDLIQGPNKGDAEEFKDQASCGRDQIYRIIKELMNTNYMDREILFGDTLYIVYEAPFVQRPENQDTENQCPEKPTLHNTDKKQNTEKIDPPATQPRRSPLSALRRKPVENEEEKREEIGKKPAAKVWSAMALRLKREVTGDVPNGVTCINRLRNAQMTSTGRAPSPDELWTTDLHYAEWVEMKLEFLRTYDDIKKQKGTQQLEAIINFLISPKIFDNPTYGYLAYSRQRVAASATEEAVKSELADKIAQTSKVVGVPIESDYSAEIEELKKLGFYDE